jgi:hypothetical protein
MNYGFSPTEPTAKAAGLFLRTAETLARCFAFNSAPMKNGRPLWAKWIPIVSSCCAVPDFLGAVCSGLFVGGFVGWRCGRRKAESFQKGEVEGRPPDGPSRARFV